MHGFALDEKGRKMSKSLGNVVEPEEVAEKLGADVLRFYMLSATPVWEDLKFSWEGARTVERLLGILWNIHVFATTYMALDGFDPGKVDPEEIQGYFSPEDRWLLSRINTVVRDVTEALENFELQEATRVLANFIVEDLSRWYIKLIKNRVWIEKEDPRKIAAYVVLYQTMHVLMRLLSPFMPHITEVIYRDLVRSVAPSAPESVHMLPWPEPDETAIDKEIERGMEMVKRFVEAGARLRQESGLKLRWPVRRVILRASNKDDKRLLLRLEDLLKAQLNCKELTILGPGDALLSLAGGKFKSSEIEGGKITIDLERDEALLAEAMAREVVRRFQVMRKEMGLEMEERVDAGIVGEEDDLKLLSTQQDYIKREVRINNLDFGKELPASFKKKWKIDEKEFLLCLKKL
ncbi:MAG: class I tRNA ligase family protein [Candidatus Hadarchaeales archaeon]